jgi:hypothetical protein
MVTNGTKWGWNMKTLNIAAIAACCTLAVPGPALAASDGIIGATSSGSVSISATVPGRVQISKLTDLVFGTVDPTANAAKTENLCVWSNTSGRTYQVTATGSGGGTSNTFALTDGTTELPYSVEWAGTSGQSSGTALATGTALTGLTSAAVNPTCSSGAATTASLIVKMAAADLQAAVASSYTGTLTLVVAPQ